MTDCLGWLVTGLFIGAALGFMIAALMHAARDKREGT
jgi:H+/Cl- antiporter ClcA